MSTTPATVCSPFSGDLLAKSRSFPNTVHLRNLGVFLYRRRQNTLYDPNPCQFARWESHLVVYYVIALALYMQCSYREVLRCLLEGIQWLTKPEETVRATGKSGISQARSRLGAEPLRRLYEQVVVPIALEKTPGAHYRRWRLISLDGSTLDVADTEENENEFGRPAASRGSSAYPQLRFVALLENGTHVLLGSRMGSYATSEITLAKEVVPQLKPGMLCLADRFFFGFTAVAPLVWTGISGF